MSFEWLKEKAKGALKAVEDTGTALINEVQSLGGSAISAIKSMTGSDAKKPESTESKSAEKAAAPENKTETKIESKSDATVAKSDAPASTAKSDATASKSDASAKAEHKTETKTATNPAKEETKAAAALLEAKEQKSNAYAAIPTGNGLLEIPSLKMGTLADNKTDDGVTLRADAATINMMAISNVSKELGIRTSAGSFLEGSRGVIKDVMSLGSQVISLAQGKLGLEIGLGAIGTISMQAGKAIGLSASVFDVKEKDLKVAVVNDQGAKQYSNVAAKILADAKVAAGKQMATAAAEAAANICSTKVGSLDICDVFKQLTDDQQEQKILKVKDEQGKVTELNVPKGAERWITREAAEASKEKTEAKAERSNFEHSSTNERGERTDVTALPGQVRVVKFDKEGKEITRVDKTAERTILVHADETARQEGDNIIVEGKDYHVVIDKNDNRKVQFGTYELTRDGKNLKAAQLKDNTSGAEINLEPGVATVPSIAGNRFKFAEKKDDLDQLTEQLRKETKEGEHGLLVLPGLNRLVLDKAVVDIVKDHTVVKFQDGRTYLFSQEKESTFITHAGQQVAVDSEEGKQLLAQINKGLDGHFKYENGKLNFDKTTSELGGRTVMKDQHNSNNAAVVDLKTNGTTAVLAQFTRVGIVTSALLHKLGASTKAASPNVQQSLATETPAPSGTAAATSNKAEKAATDSSASDNVGTPHSKQEVYTVMLNTTPEGKLLVSETQTTAPGEQSPLQKILAQEPSKIGTPVELPELAPAVKIDLASTTIDTTASKTLPKIIDTPEVFINTTSKTTIDKKGTVRMGGNDGPTLDREGNVRVDRNTFVSKDMHVESAGWQSSAAQQKGPISEAQAQGIAMTVSSRATQAYSKAMGGLVRWSEVADLNCALGDVLSMMGMIPAGSPAHAILMRSYSLIMQALSVAAPKAQQAERAIAAGANESQAKQFASPEKKSIADVRVFAAAR